MSVPCVPLDANLGTLIAYNCAYGTATLTALACGLIPHASGAKLLLGLAHLEMLSALYRFSLRFISGGSLFVSIAWGAYALLILLWARSKKDRAIGQSAVLILGAVSLKAAFYDILATGNLVRILSLLFAGILLYARGWIYNRMKKWGPIPCSTGDHSSGTPPVHHPQI